MGHLRPPSRRPEALNETQTSRVQSHSIAHSSYDKLPSKLQNTCIERLVLRVSVLRSLLRATRLDLAPRRRPYLPRWNLPIDRMPLPSRYGDTARSLL